MSILLNGRSLLQGKAKAVLSLGVLPPTPTPTVTPTITPTPTSTPQNTPTNTLTPTQTNTASVTAAVTNTPTLTQTPTQTSTQTQTPSNSPTQTLTQTQTPTPTLTQTQTQTSTNVGCYSVFANITQQDLNFLSGNTESYFNGELQLLYIDCSGNTASAVYTSPGETYQGGVICVKNQSDIKYFYGYSDNVFYTGSTYFTSTAVISSYPCGTQPTPTPTLTQTQTPSQTQTSTPSITTSQTPTPSITASQTQTPTNTVTQTQTPTPSITASQTQTPTNTVTQTQTPTPSITASQTQTPTPSITASQTQTPTNTMTQTQTPTPSITASQTQTPTPSITASQTQTPTPSITASQTQTPTPSITASQTQTPTNTSTPTNTPTQTQTPTNTSTPTNTPTQTVTPSSVLYNCSSCTGTGWIPYSSTQCYKQTVSAATPPTYTVPLQRTGFVDYSRNGTRFFDSGYTIGGTGSVQATSTTNNIWYNQVPNSSTGPMNRCAIWYTANTLQNTWIGFSTCLSASTINATKTYYVGTGADNEFRLVLDGQVIIDTTYGSMPATDKFKYWNVYPVTIPAGNHTLELYGLDFGIVAGFGMEIYDNTLAQLTAATSTSNLNIIWTSSGYTTAEIVQDTSGYYLSSGYTCTYPAVYSVCSGGCIDYVYCDAPGITPTPTHTATQTPTQTQTPTPVCTAPSLISVTLVSGSLFTFNYGTLTNCTALTLSRSRDQVNWTNSTAGCTTGRQMDTGDATGTWYFRLTQVCSIGGSANSNVVSYTYPTPTPTQTATQTPTPTNEKTEVTFNICGSMSADGSGNIQVTARAVDSSLNPINVDTAVNVYFEWTGDLFSTISSYVTINSGQSCGNTTVGGAQIGENVSTFDFDGPPYPISSGTQNYSNGISNLDNTCIQGC